jgi:hypothetical protein
MRENHESTYDQHQAINRQHPNFTNLRRAGRAPFFARKHQYSSCYEQNRVFLVFHFWPNIGRRENATGMLTPAARQCANLRKNFEYPPC